MKSTRNFIIALLSVFVVAEAVLAWRQYEDLIVLRAQVETDNAANLRKRLADDQKRLRALQNELMAARSRRNADDAPRLYHHRTDRARSATAIMDAAPISGCSAGTQVATAPQTPRRAAAFSPQPATGSVVGWV